MPRPYSLAALIVLLTNCVVPSVGRAQSLDQPMPGYVIKRWGTVEGLPHNSASAIVQTRDGYLWIGTTNAGLARFDGHSFKTFNIANTRGLPSNGIQALHEAADGTLWIGTAAGLARHRDGAFTSERLGDDAPQNVIVDVRADSQGRVWVATQAHVVRRDDAKWSVVLTGSGVNHLALSANGAMWMATDAGLVEWRERVIRTLTTSDGLPSDSILAVHEDRRGRLWIGTARGLAYLDRGSARAALHSTNVPARPIEAIFEDSRGVLWIASKGRLFARSPNGGLSTGSLSSGGNAEPVYVLAFAEDREGHVWFGGQGTRGGLYRVSPARVTVLGHPEGLPCDNMGAITEAPDGTVWIAAFCNTGRGLFRLRNGRLTEYLGPTYIESLLAEPDGTLWVGTFRGHLHRLDPSGQRFEEVLSSSHEGVADEIAVIYRHEDGDLWLGTTHGLLRLHDERWTRLRSADGLAGDDVRSIAGGPDGSLWIGTSTGLSRYHEGRFTSYSVADGVPAGPMRGLHIDADGVVWVGTYGGGLGRLKNGVATSFGVLSGLLDSSVHRIIEDDRGFLWLPGDRGIRRVSKQDLNAVAEGRAVTPAVMLFNEADGMRSVECNGMAQPAGWRADGGSLYFPTQLGVVRIDPVDLTSQVAPPPHVEDVLVDGIAVPMREEISVPAGTRDLEIHYTAPAFTRPELVQFRYRLDGYHAGWIEVGTRRLATLANLRPGQYRFLVDARNSGGPWSEQSAVVSLNLHAYFYQRLPFQIAIGVLGLAIAVVAGRSYVLGLRRRARELERAVAERTEDLSRAHDSLSTAHESLGTAKREVEQAHGQVLAVLNQLDIGVLVLSAAGSVRYASASAQRVLRKAEQELVGQSWMACLPVVDADRPRLEAWVGALSRGEERVAVQMVIGGTRYWAEIDIRDEPPPGDGRILYIYGVTEVSALFGEAQLDGPHGLVGRSTVVRLLHRQIRDVARVESTVLIQGETGVGKELVARAIHRLSPRSDKPFIAVNAAGLSESILASQLFGHRRGAFTGAVDDQPGVFEAANGGTLFLDEIGDMPSNVQVSLLRVLQEREITRLGESHARRVDVRFLAATHRDLAREVEEGRFREDLLYRVRVATITVPPLRDRLEDVPLLVDAFLKEAVQHTDRPVPHISRAAIDALLRHKWPGNVRELRAAIERSLVTAQGDILRREDLPPEIIGTEPGPVDGQSERDRIVDALRRASGNRAEAARLLGVSRTTLYRRIWEYGIDGGESDKPST